jgi:uncharacterized membrane protein YfcA
MFEAVVVSAALFGGIVASVAGFGIGSLLTPALAVQVDTRLAVAAVSIPHLVGTALRFWLLGARVDTRVLWTFGVMSAAGGLAGALLQQQASSPWLMVIFGGLLVFSSVSEFTGLARRMRFHGPFAWIAGATSGFLGGLVGNQGGIRSAALLGAHLPKELFVSTATAIGLMVDAARVPVYVAFQGGTLARLSWVIALATAGVIAGTLVGFSLLRRMPEAWFRRVVALVLAVLGGIMILEARR